MLAFICVIQTQPPKRYCMWSYLHKGVSDLPVEVSILHFVIYFFLLCSSKENKTVQRREQFECITFVPSVGRSLWALVNVPAKYLKKEEVISESGEPLSSLPPLIELSWYLDKLLLFSSLQGHEKSNRGSELCLEIWRQVIHVLRGVVNVSGIGGERLHSNMKGTALYNVTCLAVIHTCDSGILNCCLYSLLLFSWSSFHEGNR